MNSVNAAIACRRQERSASQGPPFELFHELRDADPLFGRTWDHKRKDFAEQSFAAYENALAELAVGAGWGDQEVVDLLIAHRRRWLEDPLMLNCDLIEDIRTRGGAIEPQKTTGRKGMDQQPVAPAVVDLSPQVAIIRRAMGIPVARVRKLGKKRGQFELVLDDGATVDLGTASSLQRYSEVNAAVMDAVGRTLVPMKGEVWRKLVDAVLAAARTEETGNSPEEETRCWLQAVMDQVACVTLDRDNPAEMAKNLRDHPNYTVYRSEDQVFISMPGFIRWVHINYGVRCTWPDMALRLKRLGFRREQVAARDSKGTVKARLWVSRRGFDPSE